MCIEEKDEPVFMCCRTRVFLVVSSLLLGLIVTILFGVFLFLFHGGKGEGKQGIDEIVFEGSTIVFVCFLALSAKYLIILAIGAQKKDRRLIILFVVENTFFVIFLCIFIGIITYKYVELMQPHIDKHREAAKDKGVQDICKKLLKKLKEYEKGPPPKDAKVPEICTKMMPPPKGPRPPPKGPKPPTSTPQSSTEQMRQAPSVSPKSELLGKTPKGMDDSIEGQLETMDKLLECAYLTNNTEQFNNMKTGIRKFCNNPGEMAEALSRMRNIILGLGIGIIVVSLLGYLLLTYAAVTYILGKARLERETAASLATSLSSALSNSPKSS